MRERGRNRRRHLRARIPEISATLHSPGDVEVLDLSLAGMAIKASADLEPGDHCFLELRHHKHSVCLEVEVRWTSVMGVEFVHDRLLPFYQAGVAFLEIVPDREPGIFEWLVVDPVTKCVSN